MKMKKFIAVLAAASMVAAMAVGCGGGEDTSAEGTDAATEEGGEEAAAGEWDAANMITVVQMCIRDSPHSAATGYGG